MGINGVGKGRARNDVNAVLMTTSFEWNSFATPSIEVYNKVMQIKCLPLVNL